ncbi:GNAT family N-acetyltransferase [Amycolatopsis antarctica]|uniref:GNAT family N-acetyltransferase n=1 Tax=Amycolatopsis antarctica TaxID=1854586 RepID=A0A263CWS0_9PSEU|nr:GNAT family N-acetyltransferase [Amycolatopsis antarctica]OZM70583.1 GNAT family N-acetyltransferase [Amycolatopsis antarctica]
MAEVIRLGDEDAGELLTLQRAAYVTEARAHRNLDLPPLLETVGELLAALRDPAAIAWGIREGGRLAAGVWIRVDGVHADVARLVVAPDRQGAGLGRALLTAAEARLPPGVRVVRLFTGEHSLGALRLYARLGYREVRRTPEHDYLLVHLQKHLDVPPSADVR